MDHVLASMTTAVSPSVPHVQSTRHSYLSWIPLSEIAYPSQQLSYTIPAT